MSILKFPELEEGILKFWQEHDIFKKTLAKESPRGRFVFYDGPPTANGIPHIGHLETRAFKDIIPRFKTMQGFQVERKAGWDTQGLPVELEVEKALGISGKKDIEKYGIEKFNQKAKESVWKYKDRWEKMTERIGFWLDLERPYITYSHEYIESLWWIFGEIWKQDLLQQDFKVVPYCPRCGTALSSHEVAQGYKNVSEPSVYVKFELAQEAGTFILAWTTTPWTLPGNVALAVNEAIQYVKVKAANGERMILAKALIEKLKPEDRNIEEEMYGIDLVGTEYLPLFDWIDLGKKTGKKAYYVGAADFVTTEDGTGIVHTAVMYGEDDFQLGKQLDLPRIHTVDEQGKFNELVPPWQGMEVKDAAGQTQQTIIRDLEVHGRLYQVSDYEHDYPFCWRCKHPLLYYAKTSWFIRMSKLRDQLLKKNSEITWHPGHIQDGRFGEWLREVKDWAISRERYWGTPIPIWRCDHCRHQEVIISYHKLQQKLPRRNRYIFIRHGQSENNVAGTLNTILSQGDPGLTELGKNQAAQAAEKLHGQSIDAVYTSQFARAKETAQIISDHLHIPISEDPRINEYHIGPDFEGKSVEAFHIHFGDRTKRLNDAPPGGETWLQMRARMFQFLHELDAKHQGKTFLIVTHADPIYVTQWALSLLPPEAIQTMEYPKNGAPVELQFPATMFQPDGSFDPHRPYVDAMQYPCLECKQGTMRRIPEVADAWFDSGAMPYAQWHYPFENKERIEKGWNYPADYISEAIDQTRGWFYTLLAVSVLLKQKKAPYKNVIVLGHLNDATGRKLSKSLGNYGSLDELFQTHGSDALRWFMYSTNQPWDPKNFDPKLVDEGVKKTFLILLNVLSFWKLFRSEQTAPVEPKHPLDRWILQLQGTAVRSVTERLEQYDITSAARTIGSFITDLSTWYVRRSRGRFKGAEGAASAAVLRQVLETTAVMLAPFTPFLAEHVYREVGGKLESVHLADWPAAAEADADLLKDMELIRRVVEQGHSLRAGRGIKVRQPLAQLAVKTEVRPDLDEIIRDELNVKEIHVREHLPTGSEWALAELVALDTTITDELKEEGMVRDLVREVNALRKTAGLQPGDEIIFQVEPNTVAAQVVDRYHQSILQDIRAKAATPALDGATHTASIELGGQKVTIGLRRP